MRAFKGKIIDHKFEDDLIYNTLIYMKRKRMDGSVNEVKTIIVQQGSEFIA